MEKGREDESRGNRGEEEEVNVKRGEILTEEKKRKGEGGKRREQMQGGCGKG